MYTNLDNSRGHSMRLGIGPFQMDRSSRLRILQDMAGGDRNGFGR